MDSILSELEKIKFPQNRSRKNVSDVSTSFCLGEVNYRGQAFLGYKTRGPSRYNQKFPELYKLLTEFMVNNVPDFEYTTIQVNKNVLCKPHIDKNNVGESMIIGLGNYLGGNLVIEGKSYDIKNKMFYFNGKLGHWVEPFTGDRYSLIFFTHTFKPPSVEVRNIVVSFKGIYKKSELIKKYEYE